MNPVTTIASTIFSPNVRADFVFLSLELRYVPLEQRQHELVREIGTVNQNLVRRTLAVSASIDPC